MTDFSEMEEKFAPFFRELAEIVNQQPAETRERTRRLIGEYFHDIKHTLGLITGANTIIERDLQNDSELFDSFEMIQISNNASLSISSYVNLVTDNFTSLIDADVIN